MNVKGFLGLLVVVILSSVLLIVWATNETEAIKNGKMERKLILLEKKINIEDNIRYLMKKAIEKSKNKEELISNILLATIWLEKEYENEGVRVRFSAGWCPDATFEMKKELLEHIVEYVDKPMISHGDGSEIVKRYGYGRHSCIKADIGVEEINFTINWVEGEI